MPDDLSIHRYTNADRQGVFELLRVGFSGQYANHLIGLWDWKYDSHPLNREAGESRRDYRETTWPRFREIYPPEVLAQWGLSLEEFDPLAEDAPYILLVKDRARIVAMMGSLPQAFLINGARHLVAGVCDVAVHPDYRGNFLSMRLRLRLAVEHRLVLGWTNISSATAGVKWRKRTPNKQRNSNTRSVRMRVVALVKPIDWSYMVNREFGIALPRGVAAVVAAGAQRVTNPLGKPAESDSVEVFKLESFDRRIDELWQRASREHQVIGVRDSDYLNWRFNLCPEATYQCIAAARGSQIVGYLIYRIVEKEGAPWGYIVDFLAEGDPNATFALMVGRVEELMIREGVKSIVCFSAKAPFRRVLRRAGFYPAIFGERVFLSGGVTQEDPRLNVFAELPKWFVTMGDGDADMLS